MHETSVPTIFTVSLWKWSSCPHPVIHLVSGSPESHHPSFFTICFPKQDSHGPLCSSVMTSCWSFCPCLSYPFPPLPLSPFIFHAADRMFFLFHKSYPVIPPLNINKTQSVPLPWPESFILGLISTPLPLEL
jgi:hypothetical protein